MGIEENQAVFSKMNHQAFFWKVDMLEFELWYLIVIPVMFVAGWWFRGLDQRQREREMESTTYFKGINLFLNDQPDKAIDAFIEVAQLDPQTIELHHALGNLFCRRGEFDRAVRIHTYLLNREDLPNEERALALFELSNDYLKAGLYDRAESSFKRLVNEPSYCLQAKRALLKIYCTEKEWLKAEAMARELDRQAGENHQVEIAQFYCEMGEQAIKEKDYSKAQERFTLAIQIDMKCVRALIALGDLSNQSGDVKAALQYWNKIEKVAPSYLILVIPRIAKAYEAIHEHDKGKQLVLRALSEQPNSETLTAAVEFLTQFEGEEAAMALLKEQLRDRPTLLAFEMLSQLRLKQSPDDAELKLLSQLLKKQVKTRGRYQCSHCGFQTKSFQWACPGCSSWGSYPPVRQENRL